MGLDQWSGGVLEYWSVGKDIQLSTITPALQYSNTPKLNAVEKALRIGQR